MADASAFLAPLQPMSRTGTRLALKIHDFGGHGVRAKTS